MPDEDGTQDVNESVVEDTTVQDSSPVEQEDSHVEDTTEEVSEDETDGEVEEADEHTEDETEETETEDRPQSKGEQRRDSLNAEIRDLVAQRNQIRQQVEQLNAQAYKAPTVDDLLDTVNPETGDYYNRLEAQVEAMRQEREIERYTNQVADSRFALGAETQRALEDFPMFDSNSPDYNAELAQEVDQILGSSLRYDERTNQVIGSAISPYQLYKSYAVAARQSAAKAEVKVKKDTAKMMTNADRPTGGKGTVKPFGKMTTKQMEAELRRKGHDV